jgi:transcription initiation factor TFIIE subunit beta
LLQAIKTSARDGKGLHIREIKDSWPGVVAEIEQLEKEGRIFATRTAKDNQPKVIFWNEMTEEEGGRPVDKGIYSHQLRPFCFAPPYNPSQNFRIFGTT